MSIENSNDITSFKTGVANLIQERLKKLKITRISFAAMMGVSPSVVTKWLSGTHNFTCDTLYRIQTILNFKILYVFMNNELALKKTTAHVVVASTDERSSGIIGYYSSYTAASINTKGVGWWGSDGSVEERTVYTDGDQIYEVKCLGKFADISQTERQTMIDRIKAKLSPEEWDFYKQNVTQ